MEVHLTKYIRQNNRASMKFLAVILCLFYGFSYAQQLPDKSLFDGRPGNIPLHPNVTDSRGLRQGWWTIALGSRAEQIAVRAEDVAYYRIIEFKDDKPVGIVKDYYPTGTLYQEMTLEKMRFGK